MLSDSIALQSVQGEFRCTGIPQVCEVCTAMALSCWVAYCGYLFRESWNTTTDTIANWTMLQSGKGALLRIRAFHERQHVQLELSLLCIFGR